METGWLFHENLEFKKTIITSHLYVLLENLRESFEFHFKMPANFSQCKSIAFRTF